MTLYGGIEGGGTKFVCAIGTGPDQIVAETSFPTTTGFGSDDWRGDCLFSRP